MRTFDLDRFNPAKMARPVHADGRRYVRAIDGLRCLAAFGVISAHVGSVTVDGHGPSHHLVAYYGAAAYPALIVFFMISGFLVYRPFARAMLAPRPKAETEKDRSTKLWIYLLRRVLRIFPLYWAVLFSTILLPHVLHVDGVPTGSNLHGITDWVQAIFLLPFPHPDHLLFGPLGIAMWTLAIELPFYVVIPIYAAGVRQVRRRFADADPFHVQVACVSAVIALIGVIGVTLGGELAFPVMSLPVGMLMAILETRQSLARRRYPVVRFLSDHWYVALAAYVLLVFVGARIFLDAFDHIAPGADPYAARRDVYFPIQMAQGLLLFIPVAFGMRKGTRGLLVRFFSAAPLQILAPLTYGVYLWHPLVIRYTQVWFGAGFLGFPFPGTKGFGMPTLFISLGLAIVTFVCVELPAAKVRTAVDRWSRGESRSGVAVPAAAPAAPAAPPARPRSAATKKPAARRPGQAPPGSPTEDGGGTATPTPTAETSSGSTTNGSGRARPAATSARITAPAGATAVSGTPWCQPLDGFRAICAGLAVTGHTFLASGLIGSSAPLGVLGILVALFFAISGYVLYQPFLEADVRRVPRPSAGGFYVRRLLRIYPLFALALTTYLIVLPEVRPDNAWGYVRCYLFLQIFGRELAALKGLPSAWYLCNEVIFYLAMPLLAAAAARWSNDRRRKRPEDRLRAHLAIGWGLVILGPVTRSMLYVLDVPQPTSLPFAHLEFFGFGLVTAGYAVAMRIGAPLPRPIAWLRDNTTRAYALVLVPVGLLVINATVFGQGDGKGQWLDASREDQLRFFPYLMAIVLLMVAATLGRPTDPANRWLSSRWFKPLSGLALHIYLWHQLVLGVMNKAFGPAGHRGLDQVDLGPKFLTGFVLVLVALSGSVFVSWLSQPITDWPYQRYRAVHGHLRGRGSAPEPRGERPRRLGGASNVNRPVPRGTPR